MAKRLRKTLPKNLAQLFEDAANSGDDAPVLAALEACLPDARGGYGKATVLAFRGCTRDVARWAVDRGTDVNAGCTYGKAPLHYLAQMRGSPMGIDDLLELGADLEARCSSGRTALHYAVDAQNLPAVETLLSRGLDPDAPATDGRTALEWGLQRMSNVSFPAMVPVVEVVLAGGAQPTESAQEFTRTAAERFEFHRAGFNAESVEETAAAMVALCGLLQVDPPGGRRMHDGTSPIVASSDRWQDQHAELWDLLVPSKGACQTVQGEVIRITGRISNELLGNGGCNWDREYRAMTTALVGHLGSGEPLGAAQLDEAKAVASRLLEEMNGSRRLTELAVAWVAQNPTPLSLATPSYQR